MAKQTYTTGQVLTAAQMTALQANDYNWTVSAKTASYVLVAADAGTRITMSNAGATTITVNTALFTAGDTLTITNIGAGACTITAGTATVSTAGSLVLNQYDSGTLYFSSTSASIWNGANPGDITGVTAGTGISGGGTSGTVTITNSMATEITAKGDLIAGTGSATFDNLPVGTNGQTLVADSSTATGLAWSTPSSGGMTLLSTTTLSGGTTDISSISGSYTNLVFVCHGVTNATANGSLLISPNLSLATNQNFMEGTTNGTIAGGAIYAGYNNSWLRTDSANTTIITIYNYAATTFQKPFTIISNFLNTSSARIAFQGAGIITSNNAITSIRFDQSGGDFSTGTVLTYGVK